MCLTGVDYFSTLGYQPSIAFAARARGLTSDAITGGVATGFVPLSPACWAIGPCTNTEGEGRSKALTLFRVVFCFCKY